MTTTFSPPLPGFEPPVTRACWTGIPQPVIFEGDLVPGWLRIYSYLLNHSGPDRPFRGTNEEIAGATHLHPGHVNRLLRWLKETHPPGIDHPYILVQDPSRKRKIWVLYRGNHRAPSQEANRAAPAVDDCLQWRVPGADDWMQWRERR